MIPESLFKPKSHSNLYINYINSIMKDLYYEDNNTNIIKGTIRTKSTYNYWSMDSKVKTTNSYHYWNLDVNNNDNVYIVTGNITLDNIMKSKFNQNRLKIIDFDTSPNKNKDNNTFSVTIPISDNNEITIDLLAYYVVLMNISDKYTYIKIKNAITNKIETLYYIDSTLVLIYDLVNHTETSIIDNQQVVYEFSRLNLSLSNYIQYHQPIRVTNYSKDIQFVMKYNEYGIMTSMIDISNPDIDLCTYYTAKSGDANSMISIHPFIYDPFDIYSLQPDIMNDITVTDKFTIDKHDHTSYSRNIETKNIVVDY